MESIFDLLRNCGAFEILLIVLIYLYHNIAYEDAKQPPKTSEKELTDSPRQPDLPVFDLDSSSYSKNFDDALSPNKTIRPATSAIPVGLIEIE